MRAGFRLRAAVKMLLAAVAVVVVVIAGGGPAGAQAPPSPIAVKEKRVALVIGIGGYLNAPKLTNPLNDARRMSEALRRLGFEVEERLDPDFRALTHSLREFGIRAQQADAALVYYAGHGVQVDRQNYLLPVDAKLERERDLLYEALPLELVLGEASAARKVGIVLLDACRNNPFSDRLSRAFTIAGRAPAMKGLARVDQVPSNTIVVMATKADQIAEDGSGENSPFTEAVLAHLQIPGLELSLFFRSVRDTVLRATGNRQEPYIFSSLGAEPWYFYPRPPNRSPELQPIVPLEVPDSAGPTPLGLAPPTDPDHDPLTVRVTGLPRSGEIRAGERVVALNDVLTLDRFAALTYKPDGSRVGKVGTFDFLVEDGRGGTVLGVLPVTVLSSNHPPIVEGERRVLIYPGALAIVPPVDPDGDPLVVTITGLPTRGFVRNGSNVLRLGDRLQPQDLARLSFTPDAGAVGASGALRYVVDDGRGGKSEGRVEIDVAKPEDATALISEATLWNRIWERGDPADIEAFLRLFPDSRFAAEARRRREEHLTAAGPATTNAAPEKPTSAGSSAASLAGSNQPVPPSPAVQPIPPAGPAPAEAKVAAIAPPPRPPSAGRGGADGERVFQDCATCPTMIRIPGGTFMMGAAAGEPGATPQHQVTVRPFAIAQYPVTVSEWKQCAEERVCQGMPRMAVAEDRTPLHNASWDDAQNFVAWLSRKSGRSYRLPTEAEWEYAARANTTTRYWWGNEIGVALANCADCGGQQNHLAPLPVGSFRPNGFGLNDMLGGVAQWVQDCWIPNYQGAPTDGSAREQKNCAKRVLRGGSFRNDHVAISSAARNNYDASVRYITNGFRVARDLD